MASGYIAGGAIAGILIAFMAGVMGGVQTEIEDWAKTKNPVFGGPYADALSMLPFVALAALLYFTAVRGQKSASTAG
jgi:hypothetical protein